jgi:FKBP-type peptidyl-prolyl cis-trans isomerase (trigger factor)
MKIRSNTREGNKIILEVEEEYSTFTKAVDQTLLEAGKELRIPGFRPGKAPREMIEKAVDRKVVESRAAQDLIGDLYPAIIDETGIDPVDFPNVEILQLKKKQSFVFKLTIDVYPEVKLGKYKGLKVEKKKVQLSDEDVMTVLGNFQQRLAKTGPDGKKEELPLDDAFAKKISHFGTLAELKLEVRQTLLKDRQAQAESELKNNLIAEAANLAQVDIPLGMIEREVDIMLDELKTSLAGSGLSVEGYLKGIKKDAQTLREELRKSAEVRVRGKVVLRQVAEAEKIEISEAEMQEEIKGLASTSGKSVEEMGKELDPTARKFVKDYMLRRKALDLLVEKAKIKEVEA